jgi:hypothetical protein
VPVESASPRELIRIGDIGFSADELPRLEPYLPAPVGLALGGAGVGTVIDLLPRTRRSSRKARPQLNPKVFAGVAAAVIVLGGLTYLANGKANDAKTKQTDAEVAVKKLQSQIARQNLASGASSVDLLKTEVTNVLATDIAWTRTLQDLQKKLPTGGVWLTTFQAQRTVPTATAKAGSGPAGAAGTGSGPVSKARNTADAASSASASRASDDGSGSTGTSKKEKLAATAAATAPTGPSCSISGTVTMAGVANDMPTLAQFLENMAGNKDVAAVWMSTAQVSKFGSADMVTFAVNAVLADGARSNRLGTFVKESPCK